MDRLRAMSDAYAREQAAYAEKQAQLQASIAQVGAPVPCTQQGQTGTAARLTADGQTGMRRRGDVPSFNTWGGLSPPGSASPHVQALACLPHPPPRLPALACTVAG